jgi:hypothetical protein
MPDKGKPEKAAAGEFLSDVKELRRLGEPRK